MAHYMLDMAQTPYGPQIGSAALMRRAMGGLSLAPLATALANRLQSHPDDVHALLDYAIILQLNGAPEIAMLLQERALQRQTMYSRPGGARRLLVIKGPGELMWNTPVELLLEQSDLSIDFLYLTDQHEWPATLPEHDVLLVAMAESQRNRPLLLRLARMLENWPRPVINPPQRIAALTRDGASALLQDIPGLRMPSSNRVARPVLLHCDFFPLIARPLDSHAGRDLVLLQHVAQTEAYLAATPHDEFYVSPFVDYRSTDGLYRKYRVVMIMGRAYLGHLAISSDWMVHYLNAGMADSADKRAEEAACMLDFEETFAVRHAVALLQLYQRLGLQYLQIDCAEMPDGQLLIFEVGTAMAVHAMDDAGLYPYKQPAMQRIFRAFGKMLAA